MSLPQRPLPDAGCWSYFQNEEIFVINFHITRTGRETYVTSEHVHQCLGRSSAKADGGRHRPHQSKHGINLMKVSSVEDFCGCEDEFEGFSIALALIS
jgi:hypothetical protein